jgi:hypothetical protein
MRLERAEGCARVLRWGLLVVAATVSTASAFSPLAAQTPQDVQRTAEQAIRRLDLQTTLPSGPEPRFFSLKLPPELLWVVIAIAVGVLLYTFRDLLPFGRLGRSGDWSGADASVGEGNARTPTAVVGAADELAAQGRFVEAMHVLLLQALADIRRGLGEQFADSLTSREILRSTRLSDAGRAPLRDIIDRVELTYFGQRPAALADYTACRASFNALVQALHGAALHAPASAAA